MNRAGLLVLLLAGSEQDVDSQCAHIALQQPQTAGLPSEAWPTAELAVPHKACRRTDSNIGSSCCYFFSPAPFDWNPSGAFDGKSYASFVGQNKGVRSMATAV
jgi:hypothetical protein